MTRTVLLAGAFGQHNPGDEALLAAFARELPDFEVVATSSDPEDTRRRHGCAVVASGSPAAVTRAVRRSDGVVYSGGTVFKLLPPSTGRPAHDLLRRSLALAAGARALGKPVALVGVGAGALPTAHARRLARATARRANLLVLRDEESAGTLIRAGVPAPLRIGADAAWTLLDQPRSQGRPRDSVTVALSHHAGDGGLAARLADGLAPLAAEGLLIELQPWQVTGGASDDRVLGKAVAERLGPRAELVDPPSDLTDARARFAASRLVVALRFHASVAAAAAGTPFVAYSHESKLAALARRTDQPAVDAADPTERLTGAARTALHGPAPAPAAVREQVAAAGEQFRLLRLLLHRGRTDEAATATGLSLEPTPWR